MTPSTLCRKAVNDGKLFARLQAGKSLHLNTLIRLENYMMLLLDQSKEADLEGALND